MRIVYVQQYFNTPDASGGNRPYETSRRWREAGHEVHVVTTRRDPAGGSRAVETEDLDGVLVHRIPVAYHQTMSPRQRVRAFLTYAARASVVARRLRGDVVLASSTPLTAAVPGIYATALRRTPMVFEVRDLWPAVPIALGYLRNPVLRGAALLLERVAYRRAARVIALSPDMATAIVASGTPPEKVVVATNASDVARFDVPTSAGEQFRAANPWVGSRPLIVYCGTLGRVNGVTYLVEIAAALQRRGSDAVVAVYGTGSERPEAEDRARDLGVLGTVVHFFDPVPKNELPSVLSAATLCTSFWIPVPVLESNSANKFFDSMAAGRPIAINHGGWQADVIRAEGTGLVLPARDAEQSAAMLDEWLRLPEAERVACGERARKLGATTYSRDVVAARALAAVEAAVRE
ncbi:glycosyltransferase family 4 protein [Cellulomonas sp.]|uniref:glycosyltransferase family 4 protein n=1 Tax=Cellulomonas sp. TaxID=40001 RepID=UPI0028124C36|nr:glycosyltransferase family 4 protein [Cellulomonas sp.]